MRLVQRYYLTQSVLNVVLHKSITTQIRQLTLYISNSIGSVDGFLWELTYAKRVEKVGLVVLVHRPSQLLRKRVLLVQGLYLFSMSFCKSQSPHKFVNLSYMLVIVKDKLTDLWES